MIAASVGAEVAYGPRTEAIVDALALSYWSDFEDLVAGVAEADERARQLADPGGRVLDTLAAGFRAPARLPRAVVRGSALRARP